MWSSGQHSEDPDSRSKEHLSLDWSFTPLLPVASPPLAATVGPRNLFITTSNFQDSSLLTLCVCNEEYSSPSFHLGRRHFYRRSLRAMSTPQTATIHVCEPAVVLVPALIYLLFQIVRWAHNSFLTMELCSGIIFEYCIDHC